MRKREEIWDGISGETNTRDLAIDLLEVLLDCRDLLSERHTRREKKGPWFNCFVCQDKGYVIEHEDVPGQMALRPKQVPCSCQPAKCPLDHSLMETGATCRVCGSEIPANTN